MDKFKHAGIAGLVGSLLTIIPLWVFFESRVEKRVRYELQVQSLDTKLDALIKQVRDEKLSRDAELAELKEKVKGDLWTANDKLDRWILKMTQ